MRRIGRRPGAWSPLVAVAAALAGLLFVASALTARGTDLRSSRSLQLSQVVAQRQHDLAVLSSQETRLRSQIGDLTTRIGDARAAAAARTAAGLRAAAGLLPVTGPTVTVALNDAPRPAAGRTLPGNPTPDDLVVHQQDVQGVVNALWAGGATAMTIMGQRVVSTSAVRCVGNTLLLQGRVYSPPFVVTATGRTEALLRALDDSPALVIYRQYVAAYGLGYAVSTHSRQTLPGYSGPLELAHARALQ